MHFLFVIISIIQVENIEATPLNQVVNLNMEGLLAVPRPDTTHLETVVQGQIEAAVKQLESATDPMSMIDAMAQAAMLFHAYNLAASARACYLNAILLNPSRFDWIHLLARLYKSEGEFTLAKHYFVQAYIINKEHAPLFVELGHVFLELGELDHAKQSFETALALRPESGAAHFGLGQVNLQNEDFELAVTSFTKALELVPSANRVHYGLGLALRGLGDLEKAKTHLGLAGKVGILEPDFLMQAVSALAVSESGYLAQGKKAYAAGRYLEAAQAFATLLEDNPEHTDARVNLGTALAAAGRVDDAMNQFQMVLDANPNMPVVRFNMGSMLAHQGKFEEAERQLIEVISLDENDRQAYLLLGEVQEALGKDQDAFTQYQTGFQKFPRDLNMMFRYERLLIKQKMYAQVDADFNALPAEVIKAHANLAHLYARFLASCPVAKYRDGQRSVELMTVVLAQSENVSTLETMALAHAELGDCDQAAAWLSKAVQAAAGQEELVTRLTRKMDNYRQADSCRPPLD